MNKKLLFAASP